MDEIDLKFNDFIDKFDDFGKEEWTTVYSRNESSNNTQVLYSALISKDKIKKSLSNTDWDLSIGNGLPGFSFDFKDGKEIGTYHKYSDVGVEPLIIFREFHGLKNGYWEVSEEFRLYFNLFEDHSNHKFIFIDDNGDEEEVILIGDEEIKIKTRLIKEFITVKKMRLALFFDFHRFSKKTLKEQGIEEYREYKNESDFIYHIGVLNWDNSSDDTKKSFGFLIGKKLISGLKNFKPKLSDDENKKFVKFIIGVDNKGKNIESTCQEDKLSNFFGKNPKAPPFTTYVFFKKEVLNKYYSQPEKYSIEDGDLSCGGLWSLRIDNDLQDNVMVLLGDLGSLSYKEQLHWRSCNISTKGKISRTAFMRGFEAQFADPEKSDLYFKQKHSIFQEKWEKKFGWKFFKPFHKEDEYHLKTLRIPLTNEQKEFDDQVLSLVKILIDSLNEQKLEDNLTIIKKEWKGLDKLEAFLLEKRMIPIECEKIITFLKKLQNLRSTGMSHRKGENYEKIKEYFEIDKKDLSKVFDTILIKSIDVLNILENNFLK
ncbi:MAG: hypothetical protein ACYDBX_02145 [Patescibacteria group bacterium]